MAVRNPGAKTHASQTLGFSQPFFSVVLNFSGCHKALWNISSEEAEKMIYKQ